MPVCGGDEICIDSNGEKCWAMCLNCYARSWLFDKKEEAITAWNMREASNTESDYIIGMSDNEPIKNHERICKELNALYAKKNHDYGDSFHKSYIEWGLPMAAIRLGDEYNRFCRLIKAEAEVKDESIRDTLIDLANYAILTVIELDKDSKKL